MIITILLIICYSVSNAQIFNEEEKTSGQTDSLPPAVVELSEDSVSVPFPEDSKFIEKRIKVLNRGGKPLELYNITSPCNCGNGRILKSPVHTYEVGELYFTVNTDGMYDNNNVVSFKIYSNAKNSPAIFRIRILTEKSDSEEDNSNPD